MIPAVILPLTGLSVLVTRPLPQAERLAAVIQQHGGDTYLLPAIAINPLVAQSEISYDLIVFVSVHAVEHGAGRIVRTETMRIAAIGKATAAALEAVGLKASVVPEQGFTSESLLAHPDLGVQTQSRILIVKGRGGRELLRESFIAHGCSVDLLEVYERTLPTLDAPHRDELEALWAGGEIHVITAMSVDTLRHLRTLLSTLGNDLLSTTALVVPSARVAKAAVELGMRGQIIVASGADDDAIVNALARWHARARGAVMLADS